MGSDYCREDENSEKEISGLEEEDEGFLSFFYIS